MSDNIGNFSSSAANNPGIPAITATSDFGTAITAVSGFHGTAIHAKCTSGRAGFFEGNVTVTGAGAFEGNVTVAGAGAFEGNVTVAGAGAFKGNVTVAGAGAFEGNVTVAGDVILTGADCAEEFDIAETVEIEPGTVMVIDQDGALQQSWRAYDKRVAGVVSGAGDYRPGLILDKQQSHDNRVLVALVGKVYCKVDAQYAPIEVGDLLTTSSTPGHAMKADDPFKVFGSIIGKALRSLEAGQGLIPMLIALQ